MVIVCLQNERDFIMKNFHTKIILVSAIILFLLCCTTSCTKGTGNDKIQIGILEGSAVVSFIQMIDKNYLMDGKEIEFIIKNDPADIRDMMRKSQLDFAVLPTDMAVAAYNKGVKYRMLGCPVWGALYLLTHDTEVQCTDDLHEKEIHIFKHNTPEVITRHILEQENISCTIHHSYSTNKDIADALLASEITTAIVAEPYASILCHKNPDIRILQKLKCNTKVQAPYEDSFIEMAFVVNERFINQSSHLIGKIVNAYVSSCNSVKERPEETASLLVKYKIAQTPEMAANMVELSQVQYVASFALQRELLSYLDIFYQQKAESIEGKLPPTGFIYQVY